MTVAELLTASRESHAAYRTAHDAAATGKQRKAEGWQADLWDAYDTRRRAEALDPTRLDPAWSLDRVPHGQVMAFYRQQLGLPA